MFYDNKIENETYQTMCKIKNAHITTHIDKDNALNIDFLAIIEKSIKTTIQGNPPQITTIETIYNFVENDVKRKIATFINTTNENLATFIYELYVYKVWQAIKDIYKKNL